MKIMSDVNSGSIYDNMVACEVLEKVERYCTGPEAYTLRVGGYLKTLSTWMWKVELEEFRVYLLTEYEEDPKGEPTDLRVVVDGDAREVRVWVTDETVEECL